MDYEFYYNKVIKALENFYYDYQPEVESLYEPVAYALEGGKKIRPVSVLLAAEAFGGDLDEAIIPAVAVEMFHNFTLVHDDVMDNSPIRRGRPTVFHKWDTNRAILSGDAMLLLVYQILSRLEGEKARKQVEIMTWAGLRVSEGQQLDMEFEEKKLVSLNEYLQMIRLKTAVLLGTSLKMGAVLAGASDEDAQYIYNFGETLGLTFQIQDDYFDLYADEKVFGKKTGNDIVTKKKTFLLLTALEKANDKQKEELLKIYCSDMEAQEKIKNVKNYFEQFNIEDEVKAFISEYYQLSLQNIEKIKGISDKGKKNMLFLAEFLIRRKY